MEKYSLVQKTKEKRQLDLYIYSKRKTGRKSWITKNHSEDIFFFPVIYLCITFNFWFYLTFFSFKSFMPPENCVLPQYFPNTSSLPMTLYVCVCVNKMKWWWTIPKRYKIYICVHNTHLAFVCTRIVNGKLAFYVPPHSFSYANIVRASKKERKKKGRELWILWDSLERTTDTNVGFVVVAVDVYVLKRMC